LLFNFYYLIFNGSRFFFFLSNVRSRVLSCDFFPSPTRFYRQLSLRATRCRNHVFSVRVSEIPDRLLRTFRSFAVVFFCFLFDRSINRSAERFSGANDGQLTLSTRTNRLAYDDGLSEVVTVPQSIFKYNGYSILKNV